MASESTHTSLFASVELPSLSPPFREHVAEGLVISRTAVIIPQLGPDHVEALPWAEVCVVAVGDETRPLDITRVTGVDLHRLQGATDVLAVLHLATALHPFAPPHQSLNASALTSTLDGDASVLEVLATMGLAGEQDQARTEAALEQIARRRPRPDPTRSWDHARPDELVGFICKFVPWCHL